MEHKNALCTWTGGHESSLTLLHALKNYTVRCLVTPTVESDFNTFHLQLLPPSILRAQADLIKQPLLILNTSYKEYESALNQALNSLKKHKMNTLIFSTIRHNLAKQALEQLCHNLGIKSYFPLWERYEEGLLSEFLELGFKAKIIAVNEKFLTRDFLGKDLDKDVIEEFRQRKIDLFVENGEYQTLLYEAPFFSEPLQIKEGDINLRNGNWTLDVSLNSSLN